MVEDREGILRLVINEGKDSPKYSNCNNSKFDDVECSPTNEEEDLE
jgi:hypothetical protein